MNDFALLREYALKGSETAFETLVRRHLDMVYSAAFRQTGDVGVAEEVSQAAFVLLARKAAGLSESVLVPGWLYRTACFMARKAVENRVRRRAVEREAAQMSLNDPNDEVWNRMRPHLDAALAGLAEGDRNALVLRFLQQRSFREVAGALGTSEEAARKRVDRALEKARGLLIRRGVTVALTALSAALAANSVEAARVSLVGSTLKAALGAGPVAGGGIGVLAEQAAREGDAARLGRVSVLAIAAVVLITGLGLWRAQSLVRSKTPTTTAAATPPKSPVLQQLQVMASTKPGKAKDLILRVVAAETGAPLRQGMVFGTFGAPGGGNSATQADPRSSFAIDAAGVARIPPPQGRFKGMQFWVTAPGRVPLSMPWKRSEELSLPSEYTVRLEQGARMEGILLDESGRAVAGATLSFPGIPTQPKEWDAREFVDYNTPATTPKSDAEGRWTADFISPAADRMASQQVTVSHPAFVDQTLLLRDLPAAGAAKALVMRRGCLVTGGLLDTAGDPVSSANIQLAWEGGASDPPRSGSVILQANPNLDGQEPVKASARTDESGRFRLKRVLEGPYELRASKEGFASTNFFFITKGLETNLVMTMTPSQPTTNSAGDSILRGRVTDEEGEPVTGALVEVAPGQSGLDPRQQRWFGSTDEQGRFRWNHAPADAVRLIVQGNAREGDWERQRVELAPDGTEPVIVLKAKEMMDLSLTVTDHMTGQPVPYFKVGSGSSLGNGLSLGLALTGLEFIGEGRDGKFALRLPKGEELSTTGDFAARYGGASGSQVVIRAAGYLDKALTISKQTNDLDLAVSLDRAVMIHGRVLTPAGQPATGVEVFLGNGAPLVSFGVAGRLGSARQPGWTQVSPDADGNFHGLASGVSGQVAATHDSGWALARIAVAGENVIRLRPWSRIEGTIRVGGHNWAGVAVVASVHPGSDLQPGVSLTTKADLAGHFEFPKLPDRRMQIAFFHRMNGGASRESHPQAVTLAPGETITVNIGGSGARVTGHAVQAPGDHRAIWAESGGELFPKAGEQQSGLPRIGYPFPFQSDGSFAVEDVPPGDYDFQPELSVPSKRKGRRYDIIKGVRQNVNIPESFATGGDLDLGTIEIHLPSK